MIAFVAPVCEINGELSRKLAHPRRKRARSGVLERLQRRLTLPLFAPGAATPSSVEKAKKEKKEKKEKNSRRGRHPGRAALSHSSTTSRGSLFNVEKRARSE